MIEIIQCLSFNEDIFRIANHILLRRTFFKLQQILTDSYPIFREWTESLFLRLYQYLSVCGCKVKWKKIPPLLWWRPLFFSPFSLFYCSSYGSQEAHSDEILFRKYHFHSRKEMSIRCLLIPGFSSKLLTFRFITKLLWFIRNINFRKFWSI